MSEVAEAAPAAGAGQEPNHGARLLTMWVLLSAICDPLFWFLAGPHIPPGRMSSSAATQQTDFNVLAMLAIPVVIGVLLYFGYALTYWRVKDGDETDGPPIHGNTKIQVTWISVTTALVLFLATFGTVELWTQQGAGAGQGPAPIWKPNSSTILEVQVIGQQWAWTFRYPQFGGFETTELALPVNQPVQLNVTSLDVIHSFWAISLGVKADANPLVNNVAYTTPNTLGYFEVRCAELCGIWHGSMYTSGQVMTDSNFQTWAQQSEVQLASITKMLPPFALTYDPTNVPVLNEVLLKLGLTGAGGGYYNGNDLEQP
jgi:cytochrome c oxidase subunit 2